MKRGMLDQCTVFSFWLLCSITSISVSAQSYREVSAEAGITHHFFDIDQEGGGVSFFDFNNDGWDDLYVTGGGLPDKLFENLGDGTFKDVTQDTGVDVVKDIHTMAAYTADLDNDGYSDIFLSTRQNAPCYVLWNKNGESFEMGSVSSGLTDEFYGTSIAVGDYDLDGDLDVYIGNYRTATKDVFYKNNGDRTFTNITDEMVGDSGKGAAWAVGFSDWDRDNDPDLFVVNDFGDIFSPNRLFQNNYPTNSFAEISESVSFNEGMDGMSLAVGDYDEDGDFDYYCSDTGPNNFFVNENGSFVDKASETGITVDDGTSWGAVFTDYNNDSYLDLLVMNGPIGLRDGFEHQNKLFKGNGQIFEDVSSVQGVESTYNSRGLAISDFNNDGKIDYVTAVLDTELNTPRHLLLYRNDNTSTSNWIQIELQGTTNNKDGYGSIIEIELGNRKLLREQTGGGSFMATQSRATHIGLGQNTNVDKLTVTWPGGMTNQFNGLTPNKRYKLIENGELFIVQPQKLSLKEGETAFLEGAEQTMSGIYRDTLTTTPYRTIQITRLDFNGDSNGNGGNQGGTDTHSVARQWNELLLESIRNDYARPTVHARNLFHTSIAMYDAFAVYHEEAETYFLGNTVGGYQVAFNGLEKPSDVKAAQEEAISYACYRLLNHRFKNSPGSIRLLQNYENLMQQLGYDSNYTSTDYSNGNPAALGNFIAEQLITFGFQDGSNEQNDYGNTFYGPKNQPLTVDEPGNPTLTHPNNWQPLALKEFIDQSGNVIGADTPAFLSPEWGKVIPYALKENDLDKYTKEGNEYWVYHDPGAPVALKSDVTGLDDPYKWGFALVAIWSSHLDPNDGKLIDISPASIGNTDIADFPKNFEEYKSFYNLLEGGLHGKGHNLNPVTGQPYTPQMVPKGDYTRVLAEFWADGPDSETPPGHWFTILNHVSDHPLLEKKFNGKGDILPDLEWDIKTYMTLAGAMHDAAVTAWGIKGYYDYIRPISAIRYMASKGQSSDTAQPNFDVEGIPLVPNYIEMVKEGDPLAGMNGEHVGKIKLYAWKGTHFVDDPDTDVAGVDWILAENWVPYQRPSFVTPPFAGYVSGHSTFSRAAAEVLTRLTGSKFFPGGIGVFNIEKNEFLVFEDGPSADMELQWATYQDASDQTSLSRIWGGIHPPIDDVPGRIAGQTIGEEAFSLSEKYFYEDKDGDGYYSYEDLDDNDKNVGASETTKNLEYSLYPVPAQEKITLNIKDFKGDITAYFYNILGKMVLSKAIEMTTQEVDIPIEQLPSGMYVLVFKNTLGERIIAQKIIKR